MTSGELGNSAMMETKRVHKMTMSR
ncbi:MAG: hypothetical protein K0S56_4173, partial [Microvirga sp.]|nr:hypothetical protein [Microvirga sp.]